MTTTFVNHPLPILFSARVRLSEDERATLRQAHQEFRKLYATAYRPSVLSGSTIQVETATAPPNNAYAEAGMSDLVVSDLIGSRDTIQLSILLKIEKLLGVQVVNRARLMDKFTDYLNYLDIQ